MTRLILAFALLAASATQAAPGFLVAFEGEQHRVVRVLDGQRAAGVKSLGRPPSARVQRSVEVPVGRFRVRLLRSDGAAEDLPLLPDPRLQRAPLLPGAGHEAILFKSSGYYRIAVENPATVVGLELTLSTATAPHRQPAR
jgi:hypothetical protein